MWIYGWGDLPGQLVVISGPSGSGKSSIIRKLVDDYPDLPLELSVSATTRTPRLGERDGIDYHFKPLTEFQVEMNSGAFLEFAEYNGNYYGTPAEPVRKSLAAGRCVLLEIETRGAMQVRKKAPTALFVFIDVPNFQDLASRLRARGTETEEQIHNRLVIAREERDQANCYDLRINNANLAQAVDELARHIQNHARDGGN